MKATRISAVALLLLVISTSAGCGMVNRIRARNALNEGVRAYKEGRFDEAEQKFTYAAELDPSLQNADVFIARSIQQQYRPGVNTPENIAKGEQAIAAYQRILDENPGNEDAYKAIVFMYGQMKKDDKVQEMLTQRASMTDLAPEKRAEALTVLASKQWDCSYNITEQNKQTDRQPDRVLIRYKKPENQADFDRALQCVRRGLELAEQAISLNPNNPDPWSYKTNLFQEMMKLAEMDNNPKLKEEYEKKYQEAYQTQQRLSEEARKRKEAEAAAKSPAPAG